MSAHARFSPSGAHRWMKCPGSLAMEQGLPDSAGSYAAEGTVAHEVASNVLSNPDYEIPVGETIEADGHHILVTRTMADYVYDYVKLVQEYAQDGTLLVEERVEFGPYIGVEDQFGTSDAIIVKDNELVVVDLKYGMGVKVDATDNEQLQFYALGALRVAELIGEFDWVTMVIHQPRLNHVSEWTIHLAQLLAFGDEAKEAAAKALEAMELHSSPEGLAGDVAWALTPGEKQCRFCKAKAICPALREEVMLYTGGTVNSPATVDEFAAFVAIAPDVEATDDYLSVAMEKVGMVEDWCKAIRGEVERRLLAGQTVTNYKLVQGKQGNRAWDDAAAVEEIMKKSFRLRDDQMYDQKLISPTTAEKLLKEQPKRWERLQERITRAEGKPSVAHVTDKRPALAVSTNVEDFREFASN